MNEHRAIAEDIVTFLEGQTFSEPINTRTDWLPVYKADEMRQVTVPVVPSTYGDSERLSRAGDFQHRYGIDVGVQQNIKNITQRETRTTELMTLMDEVMKAVHREQFFGNGTIVTLTSEPIFDPEQMESSGIFRAYYRFTFRVCT